MPVGGRPRVVNADGTGGHHLSGDALTDGHCVVCHEMSQHQQGTVRLWTDPYNPTTPFAVTGTPQELEPFCTACHDQTQAATDPAPHPVGEPWEPSCVDCHELHDPANANLSLVRDVVYSRTLREDKPVIFTSRTGANSFNDGDPAVNDGICQVCHTATTYHTGDGSGAPHQDGTNCTTCHPHDAGFMPVGGTSCIACHSSPQDNHDGVPVNGRPQVVNVDGSGGHHLADGALTDSDCVVCHEMSQHQQGMVRLWTDPNNPTTPLPVRGDPREVVPFCLSCHDSLTHPIIHTTGAAWEPACTQCHELHDPANANLSLVSDVVHNETLSVDKPVIFTSRTGANSFDDGDPAANDGICQACHTATAYHLHDAAGAPHNNGMNCTVCHPHSSGFTPVDGASCIKCHTSGVPDSHHLLYDRPIPPGSVVLYPDSDRDGVADPKYLCLSCHDEDFSKPRGCTVCHSASNPHDMAPDAAAAN